MMTMEAWKKVTRAEIVALAKEIAGAYQRQGLTLTLRQLYYQFVSRGLCPNGQKVYKRIGATLTDARMTGAFPIEWINDRTRSPQPTKAYAWMSVDNAQANIISEAVEGPQRHIQMYRWHGQPKAVCAWVEKEALAGVFERPCGRQGIGMFPLKGYASVSSLADWMKQQDEVVTHCGTNEVVILYFGDHDPDGLKIPESVVSNMETMARRGVVRTHRLFKSCRVTLERVALTLEQIAEVDAPPFPAKVSSSRYAGYVEETGLTEAWELDALPPEYLDRLIGTEADRHFDHAIHDKHRGTIRERRRELIERMTDREGEFMGDLSAALDERYGDLS